MSDTASTTPPTTPADQTVERFDPRSFHGELVEAEHMARYRWAAGVTSGREVLDAGCGEGYGCRLLMDVGGATRCVGVDVDESTVAAARAAYGDRNGLEYVVGDVTNLPFDEDSFDVVTCFETIEHVKAQPEAIAQLERVLRPGGSLLISSPNRGVYPEGNPFHERELTAAEFEELLSGHFPHVRLLRQHNWIASALLDDASFAAGGVEDALDLEVAKLVGRNPGSELYTVAVCSGEPLQAPHQLALLTHGLEVQRWIAQIEELAQVRRTLADTERQLLELRDRRSVEMARLERQAYWLERAQIDLDSWMKRRPLRLALRAGALLLRVRRRLTGRR
jgi:SAM-dependent methyltransferase